MLPLFRFLPASTLLLCLSISAAWADVKVTYVKPELFFGIPVRDHDRILKEIEEHFASLGKRLPPDQTLAIEITALDLAGRVVPERRTAEEIRVLKGGADWPSMHLRYRLESNGQVIRSGEDDLANMTYQQRINSYPESDDLRYEKQMIDDWFSTRFGKGSN